MTDASHADLTFGNLGEFIATYPVETQPGITDTREGSARLWTFGELRDKSLKLARGISALGFLSRGDRVALLAENSAEYLLAVSAVMRAGMVAVPVNYRLPQETIDYILEDSGCRLLLIDHARPCNEAITARKISLYGNGPQSIQHLIDAGTRSAVTLSATSPGDRACILYTSGSTGRPKGVILTHGGQTWAIGKLSGGFVAATGSDTLVAAPFYHMNGLFISMNCMANGVGVVLVPRFETRSYIDALIAHRCSLLSGIPSMFAMLLQERASMRNYDFSFVRSIIVGSAPLTERLIQGMLEMFPNASVRNAYGTTEGGAYVFGPHPGGIPTPPLSLGYAARGVEIQLVGGPERNVGALRMRSPAVMEGYLNMPEQTAQRFQEGWYDTGDVMRRDEDGFFHYIGRADDMFICGGENIYPSQIESMLERHPQIFQAAIVPIPHEIKGQVPVAFVVRRAGSTLGEQEVKEFALRNGPAYSHPRHVRFLDALPMATSFKYDRRALMADASRIAR